MTDEMDNHGKANILLVDDREDNLFVLEEMLAELGQNLVKTTSGQEALKYIFNNETAVVILDVTMPGMSGFETAALIREREKSRHIPIIFVTGLNVQESHMFQGYSLGGVDYILKPIVPEVLRAKVSVFIDLFKKTDEINKQRRILQFKNDKLQFEILERKRAENDLAELNKTLELRVSEKTAAAKRHAEDLARSNAELEQFAHIVSHDLQEPIRKIVNFSQMLEEVIPDAIDEKAKRYLFFIVDGAVRMRNLIQDLLKFSQIGQSELNLEKVDVVYLIEEILSEIQPLLEEAGAKVSISPLPRVMANPVQLRQVFQNLILNAIKFRSKKPPIVEISAKSEDGFQVFSVKDNGIGIESQYRERIFKIFQRLHTRREYPGSGIGLSICKKIVERHGGLIWVHSEPGKGSEFYFSIPEEKEGKKNGDFRPKNKRQSEETKTTPLHR